MLFALRSSRKRTTPKTLILDVYGRYSSQLQGWVAVSELVWLGGLLGLDEQAVRSALSRMTRRGLLRPEVRDRVRGYATTPEVDGMIAAADRRIYASTEPARLADGWVLVSFSMPESERDKRHLLRARLGWLGMGILSSGLSIGPARMLADVIETVKGLGFEDYVDVFRATHEAFGPVDELVHRSWDLGALADLYAEFIDEHRPARDRLRRATRPPSGEVAFATFTLALHDWRKFPYLDPNLPAELLPARWPGTVAAALFHDVRERLEPAALAFAADVVARRDERRPTP